MSKVLVVDDDPGIVSVLSDFLESPDRSFYDEKLNRERPLKYDDYRHRFNSDSVSVRRRHHASTRGGVGGVGVAILDETAFRRALVGADRALGGISADDQGKGSARPLA